MDSLVNAFYRPTVLWVEYPLLTLVPVVLFAAACRRTRRQGRRARGLVLATGLWLAYAIYEAGMFFYSRRAGVLIRIDLIVLGPLMYLITALGLLSWWRSRASRSARAAPP